MLIETFRPQQVNMPVKALALSKNWQLGQVLQALVVSSNVKGKLELQIGQETIQVQTNKKQAFNIGEKLTLRVTKVGTEPVLSVVEKRPQYPIKNLVEKLLRQSLPKADFKPFVSTLDKLIATQQGDKLVKTLPQEVRQQLRTLSENLMNIKDVKSAGTVKEAIGRSGLLMEKRLDTAMPKPSSPIPAPELKPQLDTDLKVNLLRLAKIIKNTLNAQQIDKPTLTNKQIDTSRLINQTVVVAENIAARQFPKEELARLFELRQITDAALAKIQLNQASAIPVEESSLPNWIIDLPFKDETQTKVLQIRINQDETPENQDKDQKRWNVNLSFALEGLGNIDVRIIYFADEISSSIWAENATTHEAITQNLDYLTNRLSISGLNVGSINCFRGTMALEEKPAEPEQPLLSISL